MSFALLSDAPVTNSQTAANPVADGSNLYIPTVDFSNPATGNNNVTTANIHMMKSANAGVTWAEQDATSSLRPQVFNENAAYYASPQIPPAFIIQTELFFDYPVPGIDWPPFQNIPWQLAPGTFSPGPGLQDGNDTIEINLLEDHFLILSCSLTVDGIFGTLFEPSSIGIQLCAALNAQLAGLSISPSTLRFGVGPGAVTWTDVGFSENLNDGSIVLTTSLTGSAWEISVTGNMVSNLATPSTFASVLTFYNAITPIVIWTVQGQDSGLNPIPVCFNTMAPPDIHNHVIYIAYVGLDQTVNVARYNTLTDTWMTTIVGGPAVTMIVYESSFGANVNLTFCGVLKVRSNGNLVLAYSVGFDEGVNTYDSHWAVYSGGWTSPAAMSSPSQDSCPVAAVIDASDNVFIAVNISSGASSGLPLVSTFIVKHDNTTVALHNVDASPPSYANLPIPTNLNSGMLISASGHILLVLGLSSPSGPVAYMYEISATSLLAGGSWTKMARNYANGIDQYIGAVDATFWNNQFQAIVGQGSSPSSGVWDTNVGIGTGNSTGGSADTSFSAAVSVLATTGPTPINRIIYRTKAVVLSNGSLGIEYEFLDFINQPPQYYTRFAVFSDTLFIASCNSPASGSVGGPYAHTFTSIGGVGAITWALTSGSFPTGLTLNLATGVLSGIPSAAATYTFSLTATDSLGNVAAPISCSIIITVGFKASCGSASGSTVGSSYTQTMTETGGVSPFTWSILSGALPAGTTLTPSTGVIAGTLTTAGRYYWTAKVVDSTGNFAIVSCMATICPSGV